MNERGSIAGGREDMMCHLAAAYDAFNDLQNKLREGSKFYNDLTQVRALNKSKIRIVI